MEIYLSIIGILVLLWFSTLGMYLAEKKKQKILKKNSDWATDKAREKAEGIIVEAKNAALRELSDVKLETTKYEQELEAGVKNLTDQEVAEYKIAIENITEDVEDGVKKQSEQFKTEFDEAWKKMEAEMKDKIKSDYESERKKIEEYSGVKMQEIEEKIAGITDEAVMMVLGKQVDSQVNKRLIMEALDEVKKKYAI